MVETCLSLLLKNQVLFIKNLFMKNVILLTILEAVNLTYDKEPIEVYSSETNNTTFIFEVDSSYIVIPQKINMSNDHLKNAFIYGSKEQALEEIKSLSLPVDGKYLDLHFTLHEILKIKSWHPDILNSYFKDDDKFLVKNLEIESLDKLFNSVKRHYKKAMKGQVELNYRMLFYFELIFVEFTLRNNPDVTLDFEKVDDIGYYSFYVPVLTNRRNMTKSMLIKSLAQLPRYSSFQKFYDLEGLRINLLEELNILKRKGLF